jgi:heme/copper-type cytochrome/quinol oxidase subunit 3
LGLGAVVIQVRHLGSLPFSSQDHAYGSILHLLSGFSIVVVSAAVIMGALVGYWGWQRRFSSRRNVTVVNLARYWGAAAAIWVLAHAVIGLTPYLT